MSDDLVKERLALEAKYDGEWKPDLGAFLFEVLARIKEQDAELHLMKTSGIAEVAARNPSVMEYMKHWEGRAEAAEAKLAKAVEALEHAEKYGDVETSAWAYDTLAELKGKK